MSYIRGASADESEFPTLLDIKAAFGFIPNFFRAQTLRPDLIDAEVGLFSAILVKEGALTRRQKEYIFLACSADNLSTYCVTAHCEMVRMLGIDGPEPEQIALDHTACNIPDSDKALLDLAVKLNNHPKEVGAADIDALRAHGFGDQHILEMVIMVGLAKFSNFVAFGLGTVPDFDASQVTGHLGSEKKLNPLPNTLPLINDEDVDLMKGLTEMPVSRAQEYFAEHSKNAG